MPGRTHAAVSRSSSHLLPPDDPAADGHVCLPPAQVLVLLTEASWSSFFYKVLEVAEQLLRQTDLLLDSSNADLPAKSYAGIFFGNLAAQLATPVPLGCILRVELPQAPTLLSISPPKRIGAGPGAAPLAW